MGKHKKFLALGLASVLLGSQLGSANSLSLSIVVTETGTSYYSFNGSTWSSQGASSGTWDSMLTTGNTAPKANGATSVGPTQNYTLSSMAQTIVGSPTVSTTYNTVQQTYNTLPSSTGYWSSNSSVSSGTPDQNGYNPGTEGGLILTKSGSSANSVVSNLLILDGSANIYVYNAPKTTNTPVVASPMANYGFTGNGTKSYGGTISNLGTNSGTAASDTGLIGDLEWNGGFAGNGSGANIGYGGEYAFKDPQNNQWYLGAVFGPNGEYAEPSTVELTSTTKTYIGGGKYSYLTTTQFVTPTIYFGAVSLIPLPSAAWGGFGLMCGLAAFFTIKRFYTPQAVSW